MKQPRSLDEARAAYPSCTFYLVAEPGGSVNLELVTEFGEALGWDAESEAKVWALAFPATEGEPVDPPMWPPGEQMQREAAAANPADTGIPATIGLFD